MKYSSFNYSVLAIMAAALMMLSCTKVRIERQENIIEVPSYPDLEDIVADTLDFNYGYAQFYGAYSQTVDRWYVTLFTEDGVNYDLGTDTYSGKGEMVKLCLQTKISGGKATDLKVIAGTYTCPASDSDLKIGQFETGYELQFDHPYFGTLWASYGTWYAKLDQKEYLPLMAIDGEFTVTASGKDFNITGMILDGSFTKRAFRFTGPLAMLDEYEFPGAPDSSLSKDVTLTRSELPRIEIRDRGDQYRYDNPPRFRNYRVFLTGNDVVVSRTEKIYDNIKLSGHGPVVLLDLFVTPDADGRIPAGSYEVVPRLENYGIDGSLIWPFKFVEGYPHYYFQTLQGSWYFNLTDSGVWTGDYGRITGGTLSVAYPDGGNSPVITADLLDCSKTPKHIKLNWK